MAEVNREQDAELSASLKALQKKATLWKICLGLCIALLLLCMLAENRFLVFIPFVGFILFGGLAAKYDKQIKSSVGDNILRQALDEVFEDVTYSPFDHLSYREIDQADFNISYDKTKGSDLIDATYKGLHVRMSDISLIEESTDSDGHRTESTVFKGLWMICDFGKELSADVRVCERTKLGKMMGKGGIKTENEAFNKQFNITSKVEEEAFYILTPHMMEYIVSMDERANAKTNLSFLRSGVLHLALNSGRDNFEVKTGMSDANKIREQFVSELRQVTDLIDELRITDSIFKK